MLLLCSCCGNSQRTPVHALPASERDPVERIDRIVPSQRLEFKFRKCEGFMESLKLTDGLDK